MWDEGCVCGEWEDGCREDGGKWLVCISILRVLVFCLYWSSKVEWGTPRIILVFSFFFLSDHPLVSRQPAASARAQTLGTSNGAASKLLRRAIAAATCPQGLVTRNPSDLPCACDGILCQRISESPKSLASIDTIPCTQRGAGRWVARLPGGIRCTDCRARVCPHRQSVRVAPVSSTCGRWNYTQWYPSPQKLGRNMPSIRLLGIHAHSERNPGRHDFTKPILVPKLCILSSDTHRFVDRYL